MTKRASSDFIDRLSNTSTATPAGSTDQFATVKRNLVASKVDFLMTMAKSFAHRPSLLAVTSSLPSRVTLAAFAVLSTSRTI